MSELEEKLKRLGIALRQRGSSWQVSFYKDEKRIQRQRPTRDGAIECALIELGDIVKDKEEEAQLKAQIRIRAKGALHHAYTNLCTDKWYEGCSNRDWKKSKKHAEEALAYFGNDKDPNEITSLALKLYMSHLKETRGNKPATIRNKMSALNQLLVECQELGVLEVLPKVSKPQLDNMRDFVISYELEAKMVEYFRGTGDNDMADFITLALYTGCRVSELTDSTWEMCNFVEGEFHIPAYMNKTKVNRTIPLEEHIVVILYQRYVRGDDSPFAYLTRDKVSARWRRMRRELGLEHEKDFVPHSMRHTKSTRLAQGGASVDERKLWMGHKTIQMADRYTHLEPTALRDTMQRVADTRAEQEARTAEREAYLQRLTERLATVQA
ncbi:tyrosine-type recombinase/integrase [Vibrio sp. SCSIO 43137]|uniref:tyrosine-type recombinase/integrase n=1 Tax=Vibrio sp. SCSIO 43137 TaxID=3021011 RepID=UPI0023074F32|nr:site-specific integrase [Vibrio sp. SCSIO 43137]WCE28403.1 site-specific integrase [Vibrio sp. SCSIO 43137]